MFRWWFRVVRFALLGRLPSAVDEVQAWAMCVPFVLWHEQVRYDGRSFADDYAPGAGAAGRSVLRWAYLVFLFAWPLVAALRGLKRGLGAGTYLRHALARPELALHHPQADYTDDELAKGRPDHALGMYYAWRWHRRRDPWFRLDDKTVFAEACSKAGFPLPPRVSLEEAIAQGGRWVVKDPTDDLGYGVRIVESAELGGLGHRSSRLVVEPVLRNHPVLMQAFPEDAPLSSFRVITALDPKTGEPYVVRCAIRIGRAGVDVDNTQQGGIWSKVDVQSGAITEGVTKHSFGLRKHGVAQRIGEHPDTGRRFAGLVVPWLAETKAMALEAHRRLAPEAPSLGWDLALAAEAPVFLEVNVWTASYDYDPEDDAFTPACELILEGLRER